jgi:hypothetical protein
MNDNEIQLPEQTAIRTFFRVVGAALFCVGSVLVAIGLISFFTKFAQFAQPGGPDPLNFGPPRYFWCVFVGAPLAAGGMAMLKLGYLGAIARYVAGEASPVAKDVVNYMGENTEPGVKAVAKSITEGILEAQREKK